MTAESRWEHVTDVHDRAECMLLEALDCGVAAIAKQSGIVACNGRDDAPCEVGGLHTRTADLAKALVAMMRQTDAEGREQRGDLVADAAENLSMELLRVVGHPRLS